MLLINNKVVEQILDMKGCIEALDTGYRDLVNERANYRGRYDFFVPNDDPKLMYRWGTMEGASRSFETFAIRMKSDMLEGPRQTVESTASNGTFCGFGHGICQNGGRGDHQRRHHQKYAAALAPVGVSIFQRRFQTVGFSVPGRRSISLAFNGVQRSQSQV